jgi:hypothetical protein
MLTIILRMPPLPLPPENFLDNKKASYPRWGAGSVETLCGFSGPRCSGDHPQSRLYFAAPSPEEAARKGEPTMANPIHLREFSQIAP